MTTDMPTDQQARRDEFEALSQDLQRFVSFLCGVQAFDGVNFGEKHPTERGAFWWRTPLLTLEKRILAALSHPAPASMQTAEPVGWANARALAALKTDPRMVSVYVYPEMQADDDVRVFADRARSATPVVDHETQPTLHKGPRDSGGALPELPEPYAHECTWVEDEVYLWSQWHDESDPMPATWDDEPPSIVTPTFTADQVRAYARAALATTAKRETPTGWVLVPVEPTQAMLRKMVEMREGQAVYKVTTETGLRRMEADAADEWDAALAAAGIAGKGQG